MLIPLSSLIIKEKTKNSRRRIRMVGRFPNEQSALTLVFATLEQDRLKWRGVRMDDELRAEIETASRTAMEKDVFTIDAVDSYLEAAKVPLARGWIAISTKLRDATNMGELEISWEEGREIEWRRKRH